MLNIDNSIELTNTHNNLTISGCGEATLNGGLVLDNNLSPTSDPTTNVFSSYPNSNPLNLKSTVVNNVIVVDLQQVGLSEQDLGTIGKSSVMVLMMENLTHLLFCGLMVKK